MFKKTVLGFCLICAASLAFSAEFVDFSAFSVENTEQMQKMDILLNSKISEEEIVKPASSNASEKSVLDIKISQELEVSDSYGNGNTLKSTKRCTAVVISDEFLLASKSCIVTDNTVKHSSYMGGGVAPVSEEYKVDNRYVSDFKVIVGDNSYKADAYDLGAFYLLHMNASYVLGNLPKANIFVSSDKTEIKDFEGMKVVVSRESLVFSIREVQERSIGSICQGDKCLTVKKSIFHTDAAAGDPLFIKLNNDMEFVFAFNNSQNYSEGGNGGRKGRTFRLIDENTITKMQEVVERINPEAWPALNKKIVRRISLEPARYHFK